MRTQSCSEQPFKALSDELLNIVGDKRQAEIARNLYVSQPAVNNWFSGKSRPGPAHLGLLMAILKRPYEDLEFVADLAGYACDHDPNAWDKLVHAYEDRCSGSIRKAEI